MRVKRILNKIYQIDKKEKLLAFEGKQQKPSGMETKAKSLLKTDVNIPKIESESSIENYIDVEHLQ